MPPKKSSCVGTTADRAKDRDRKRKEAEGIAENEAIAAAIEAQRSLAAKELKDFKERIVKFPYDLRVEAAAQAYRSGDNTFTQQQLAARHVIGITSLKNKIAALKKNEVKVRQDAALTGAAAVQVISRGLVLDLEADNEAHLAYVETRAQAAKAVHEKKQKVEELKAERTSIRAQKQQVLFVFYIYFDGPDFHFIFREKNKMHSLKMRRENLKLLKPS